MIYNILHGLYNIAMALIEQMKWISPMVITYIICKSDKDTSVLVKLFNMIK